MTVEGAECGFNSVINSQVMNCFSLLPTPYTLHPTPYTPLSYAF
ncbi:MAG: hypothetical protein O9332_23880 [Microcystis sp. LE19-10.1B]|nr:hypothetical protein [Microcystis sp. LE19-10.1B]MCZ8028339.1 hypothetical protein [Microcystis sp. LE19-10.1B]MCZ8362972.1 hypothetical protein [Microcystis sp. LE19-251.1A]